MSYLRGKNDKGNIKHYTKNNNNKNNNNENVKQDANSGTNRHM